MNEKIYEILEDVYQEKIKTQAEFIILLIR
jgi:hypothetical protein